MQQTQKNIAKRFVKNIALITAILLPLTQVQARQYIEVVGSSTVFPFSTVVAETFGKKTGSKTPKIESTGSGGGIKLFCKGDDIKTPDIVNASRKMKKKEFNTCVKNGVKDITEVLIGFDGITLANSKSGPSFDALTLKDIYLALAQKIPQNNKMVDNPYTNWAQINKKLPNVAIKVLGPPSTSGTRDALQELALERGCKTFSMFKKLKKTNKNKYKHLCHTIREDGPYIEMGENDNLIISKLMNDKNSLGIFGFSFLDQNNDKVRGANINGVQISFENIATGNYPISRPLYFYIKNSHRNKIKGLTKFIQEFVDIDTIGKEGYLTDKGLIPASDDIIEKTNYNALNAVKLKL